MSFTRLADSPLPWAAAGLLIGLGLGVTFISVTLLAIGLGAFVLYLRLHDPAQPQTEGMLFAAAPALIASWMIGFIIHGLAF